MCVSLSLSLYIYIYVYTYMCYRTLVSARCLQKAILHAYTYAFRPERSQYAAITLPDLDRLSLIGPKARPRGSPHTGSPQD